MEHSTPQRPTAPLFPTTRSNSQPHSSSPSTTRLAPSSSSSPAHSAQSSSSSHTISALTIESALAPHGSTPNPLHAALEAVLAERNSLSSQNAQLWKLIEKQRSGNVSMMKELERVRSERDIYKGRLHGVAHTDEKRLKSSTSQIPTDVSEKDRETEEPSSSSRSAPNPRLGLVRHQSEDPNTPRNAAATHAASASLSAPPQAPLILRERERLRTNSQPVPAPVTNGIANSDGTRTPPTFSQSQSILQPRPVPPLTGKANGVDIPTPPRTSSPVPLLIPPRSDSLHATTSHSSSSTEALIQSTGGTRPLTVTKSTPTPPPSGPIPLPPAAASTLALPPAVVAPQLSLGPGFGTDRSRFTLSRESRISLPAEARRYIANMADSPLPSPKPSGSPVSTQSAALGAVERALGTVAEEGPRKSDVDAAGGSPGPFLELEDDESEEADADLELDLDLDGSHGAESDSEGEAGGTEETSTAVGHNAPGAARKPEPVTAPAHKLRKATADQFPLPPATFANSGSGAGASSSHPYSAQGNPSQTPLHLLNTSISSIASSISLPPATASTSVPSPTTATFATATASSTTPGTATISINSSNNSINSTSTAVASSTHPRERSTLRDSFFAPLHEPPAATFRQMPLIDTDLKTATALVIGSHIRANEKGKEVLSFVVSVEVVGKEGWVIEKFYSDVLALDSRLRQRCSRSTAKKIAPLPDSKLFKDHAPAKVDQRKSILQTYMQSVLHLPVKDKNEIIVFFSSDVMRERAPITQSGYKEGYLTKRGKNFGGWKTRYFVLQGPVLEYYESRGGTHLGSIQVTGAQIGRQQKTGGDKKDWEDENEYRHAFLIIESKKGPAGQHPRHVLCAESDEERDAWVEVLVRYVMGTYNDEPGASALQSLNLSTIASNGLQPTSSVSLSDTSSNGSNAVTRGKLIKPMSKDDIMKSAAMPMPISKLSLDPATAKFFQGGPLLDETSPSKSLGPSPIDRFPPSSAFGSSEPQGTRKSSDRNQLASTTSEEPLSSSLPTASTLDFVPGLASIGQRANSELGHYPDLQDPQGVNGTPEHRRTRERNRVSYHPTLQPVKSSPTADRQPSPERHSPAALAPPTRLEVANNKPKISAPIGGTPIPSGYKFGANLAVEVPASNERERKAKSRTFWGFGRQTEKPPPGQQPFLRAVFGIPLEESLAVCQIAGLPAIMFRCIQYLETKKAEQEEGIYRLSGSSNVIKSLKDKFNAEGDIDLLANDEYWDPHAIAGLLKSFLRDLPTSILTRELHVKFLAVIDLLDTKERVKELQELISQLPLANYTLLRALTAHLILIVQNCHINKMTMRNVGIVFSPTLGVPAGVFSLMLAEFNRVFNVDGEGTDSPEGEGGVPSPKRLSGLSRRNSRQYTDAAADQLLGFAGRTLPTTEESDDGDELSANDESGTETTEADGESQTVESSVASTRATSPTGGAFNEQVQVIPPSDSTEVTPQKSRVAGLAAGRGLNITIGGSERRQSRMIGLPLSPRPIHSPFSPTFNTPTGLRATNSVDGASFHAPR